MSGINLADLVSVLAEAGIVVEDSAPAAKRTKRSTRSTRKPASATASAARKPAKGKSVESYVPTAERRAGMPTGRMLWALNAAGMLSVRSRKGSPLTFGACWDARAGIEG